MVFHPRNQPSPPPKKGAFFQVFIMFEPPVNDEPVPDDPEPTMDEDPEGWLELEKLRTAAKAFHCLRVVFTHAQPNQSLVLAAREANAFLARILPEIKIEQKPVSIVEILKEIKDLSKTTTRNVEIPRRSPGTP